MTPNSSSLLDDLLTEESVVGGRWASVMRTVASGAWVLMFGLHVLRGTRPGSEKTLPFLCGYLGLAVLLWLAYRCFPGYRRWSLWMVPALDVPAVFCIQYFGNLPYSPSPHFSAAMAAAMFMLMIAIIQLTLNRRVVLVTSGLIVVAQIPLLLRAGLERAILEMVVTLLVFAMLAAFLGWRIRELMGKAMRERTVRDQLARYFSPQVSEQIISRGLETAGARRMRVSVLFADIRGFTAFAERTDGEQVLAVLNRYYQEMAAVLFRHGATLDKFLGDGLMAYFGAPLPQEDHAARAIRCGQEMLASAERLAGEFGERFGQFRIGIGIHTGEVLVGDIGPEQRREYTAIGDAVNVAARLQDMTKSYGTALIVSGSTLTGAGGPEAAWRALGEVELRGRSGTLAIFAPRDDGALAA